MQVQSLGGAGLWVKFHGQSSLATEHAHTVRVCLLELGSKQAVPRWIHTIGVLHSLISLLLTALTLSLEVFVLF